MKADYQTLCGDVLFLQENQIKKFLTDSEIDLSEFLDFTQILLTTAMENEELLLVENLKKVQGVVIRLMDT
ncbi:MAG: hypothetical protein AABY93_16065 [Bacteroidota bacterium]